MIETGARFKWYWLLNTDSLFGITLALGIAVRLLLVQSPHLSLGIGVCLALGFCAAYGFRKRSSGPCAPTRATAPRGFTALWRFIIALEILVFAADVILFLFVWDNGIRGFLG